MLAVLKPPTVAQIDKDSRKQGSRSLQDYVEDRLWSILGNLFCQHLDKSQRLHKHKAKLVQRPHDSLDWK